MSEKQFSPTEHMMNLKGKAYLPVAARVMWFREEHPIESGWGLRTRKVDGGLKEGFAEFYCEVTDGEGRVVASGSNVEDKAGFGDFLMKAETGAIGRALAAAGYGTMAALDEGEVVDAPVQRTSPPKTDHYCDTCGDEVEAKVADIAQQRWGRTLCIQHGREMAAMEKARVPAGSISG